MMQNQADKEQQEKELEMLRLELNAQRKEIRAQRQMMQMMMATLMSHNNPISNVARNLQDTSATEGNHNVEAANVNTANVNAANVNIAGNQKFDKEDESLDKFV